MSKPDIPIPNGGERFAGGRLAGVNINRAKTMFTLLKKYYEDNGNLLRDSLNFENNTVKVNIAVGLTRGKDEDYPFSFLPSEFGVPAYSININFQDPKRQVQQFGNEILPNIFIGSDGKVYECDTYFAFNAQGQALKLQHVTSVTDQEHGLSAKRVIENMYGEEKTIADIPVIGLSFPETVKAKGKAIVHIEPLNGVDHEFVDHHITQLDTTLVAKPADPEQLNKTTEDLLQEFRDIIDNL